MFERNSTSRTLNCVRTSFRKVPNIPNLQLIHLIISVLIDSWHQNFTSVHKSPLSLQSVRTSPFGFPVVFTTRCQCSSLTAPFFKCCWAAAISPLAGISVTTCSRVQPPLKIFVLDWLKLHFRLGTVPASVLSAPRLSGFWRSIWWFVPPSGWLEIVWGFEKSYLPRIGPPLPLSPIGSPWANWDLLLRVLPEAAVAAPKTMARYANFMIKFHWILVKFNMQASCQCYKVPWSRTGLQHEKLGWRF